MDYTKNKKSKYPPLKQSKNHLSRKRESKSRRWLVFLGVLCIIAGVVIFILYTTGEGKGKNEHEIKVPYDIEAVRDEQKSVDEGHSPWKLDPLYVTQVFVSLKISPEGIQGDYPVKRDELKLIQMTKREAAVQVSSKETPITLVHLKRLVRADDTGIWTVVAYEIAQENRENVPQPNQENAPELNKENNPVPNKENVPAPNQENEPEPNKENTPEPNKENTPDTNPEKKENVPNANKENPDNPGT